MDSSILWNFFSTYGWYIFIFSFILLILQLSLEYRINIRGILYSLKPSILLILIYLAASILLILMCFIGVWLLFRIFPAPMEADKVVTVFAGIIGSITGLIVIYQQMKNWLA